MFVVLDKDGASKPKGKKVGRKFKVLSNADIENILKFESEKKGSLRYVGAFYHCTYQEKQEERSNGFLMKKY